MMRGIIIPGSIATGRRKRRRKMSIIKRRCKFFKICKFAVETSRTCTRDAGGNYCGIFRTLSKLEKVKEK